MQTDREARGTRVLVIAANPLARAGLAGLLSDQAGVLVLGQAAGDADLIEVVEVYRPDVLIWDMGFDSQSALDAASALGGTPPVLALFSQRDSLSESLHLLLNAGVRGALLQESSVEVLLSAIEAVAQGLIVLAEPFVEALQTAAPRDSSGVLPAELLTVRETQVLHLIAEGLPNKTIAQRLGISEHTVKFHINSILTKLNAQSRTDAVVRATRLGLLAL
ncbi:MAG: response regulator transcription factor [Aggregatilineales bacterium]